MRDTRPFNSAFHGKKRGQPETDRGKDEQREKEQQPVKVDIHGDLLSSPIPWGRSQLPTFPSSTNARTGHTVMPDGDQANLHRTARREIFNRSSNIATTP